MASVPNESLITSQCPTDQRWAVEEANEHVLKIL